MYAFLKRQRVKFPWELYWKKKKQNKTYKVKVYCSRLRVVPHFFSGIVERAKRERAWKSPHARKRDTRRGERKMSVACRLFSRGVIFTRARVSLALLSLEEKWGTTRSLLLLKFVTVFFFQLTRYWKAY